MYYQELALLFLQSKAVQLVVIWNRDDGIKWEQFPLNWLFVQDFDVFFGLSLNQQLSKQ